MWLYIVTVLVILYLLYVFVAAAVVTKIASHPKANTYQEEIDILKGFGYDCNAFLNAVKSEDFACKSEFGYDIHGRVFRLKDSKKAVVLCHGYGGNSTTMLSYAKIFRKLGFSVVVYDHRNFGINDKSFTSFGLYESKDLITVYNYAKTLFDSDVNWGVMGESMGGATVMMALSHLENLCFAVDDCGYSDMKSEIKIKDPLPSLGSVAMCDLFLKLKYGYVMKDVQPYKELQKVDEKLPMLFIYSKTDKIVPFWMFDKIYNSKKGCKDYWIIDDCRHAKAVFNFTEDYEKELKAFLKKNNLI